MPLPSGMLVRAVHFGSLPGGERWNCQLWYAVPSSASATDYNTLATDMQTQFNSRLWNAGTTPWKGHNVSAVTYDGCRISEYVNGLITNQGASTGSSVAGTGGTAGAPAYCAVVATLLTAGFGRARRGRMYLPWTSGTSGTTLQAAIVAQDATNMASMLAQQVFSGSVANYVSSVVSQDSATVSPVAQTITHIRFDSKIDTQRGRGKSASPATVLSHTVP